MSDLSLLLLACAQCVDAQPGLAQPLTIARSQAPSNTARTPLSGQLTATVSTPETIDSPTKTPNPPKTSVNAPLLMFGSQGKPVATLQSKLQQLGYYRGAIDGKFGTLTEAAVLKFQRSSRLAPDGLVGASTWSTLAKPGLATSGQRSKSQQPNQKRDTQKQTLDKTQFDKTQTLEAKKQALTQALTNTIQGPQFNRNSDKQSSSQTSSEPLTQNSASKSNANTPANSVLTSDINDSHNSQVNLNDLTLASVGLEPYILWSAGPILILLIAGGMILLLRNSERLSQQWQFQFQGEAAIPDSGSSGSWSSGTSPGFSKEFGDVDQSVALQQSPKWSRAVVWTIVGITGFTIIWMCTAKIDEAIPAQGKLEPQGAVQEVQAPVGGVIQVIHVKEGDAVKKGDLLVSFDPTAAKAKLKSLQATRKTLEQENQYYRSQVQPSATSAQAKAANRPVRGDLISLTENRRALMQENQLYRSELQGEVAGLSSQQQERLRTNQAERSSRIAAAQLDIEQLSRQLRQTQVQSANARDALSTNQEITASLRGLVEEGAYARLPYLQQQQQTNTSRTELDRLAQEEERLRLAIAQAEERWRNAIALSQQDILTKMAENEKRIAEIDSQLTKVILENQKQIQTIDSQISETKLTLNYQELKAPVDGTVFDLKPQGTGYVSQSSEPILKIVPKDNLVAQVFITNQDIGFIKEGMPVDVQVDSFPYSEFGDIKGTVVRVGSDALPPDQTHPFYRFPAEIRLDEQMVTVNGRNVSLQSGMSLSANIKIRQRPVISIFTDFFSKEVESLKFTR